MKTVFFVLPNELSHIDFLEHSMLKHQDSVVLRKALEINEDAVRPLMTWFNETIGELPKIEMVQHNNMYDCTIKVALKFTVSDNIATLFNLRWK